MPPRRSTASRSAVAVTVAIEASTNDARRARSSTGYPVIIISGKTTRPAPASVARLVHSTTVLALPSRSPTVALTWASAIRSIGTDQGYARRGAYNVPETPDGQTKAFRKSDRRG